MKTPKFSHILFALFLAGAVAMPVTAGAANPGPASGSVGLEATIPSPAPTQGATITLPASGSVFTATPITVSGLCPSNLLIKVFANNVFVGSAVCSGGSYSLQVDLFSGRDDLVARDFDALDQAGPDSSTVSVTFNDAQFVQFGTQVTLSSDYAERGAAPGNTLDWPLTLTGGSGPYALSVDWGDGSTPDLISQASAGLVNLKHTYQTSGVYKVLVRVTDKNGNEGFLQLVGQATGAIQQNTKQNSSSNNLIIEHSVVWWPVALALPLVLVSFWLGRRYQATHRHV